MPRFTRLRVALMVAAPFALGVLPAAAQDSTASPTPLGEPLPAVECTVEPITYEGLAEVVSTPAATEEPTPEPEGTPAPPALPEGVPADDETTAAVQQTIQELVACQNAGDFKRVLALYSDDMLRSIVGDELFTEEEFEAELGTVTPREPEEEILIYFFGDVVITADGRAAVLAFGDNLEMPPPPADTLFYLVQDDDRWLIDEVNLTPDQSDA